MQPKSQALYKRAVAFKQELWALLIEQRREAAACRDEKELTDYAYFARELSDLLDECRKNCDKFLEEATKLACLVWTQGNMAKLAMGESPELIRTAYCTGSPDVSVGVNLPRRDTPEYFELMRHFGVSEELAKLGVVQVHWPRFTDYLALLSTLGKPLPPGCESRTPYNIYKLGLTRKKGVCDELPGPDRPAEADIPF